RAPAAAKGGHSGRPKPSTPLITDALADSRRGSDRRVTTPALLALEECHMQGFLRPERLTDCFRRKTMRRWLPARCGSQKGEGRVQGLRQTRLGCRIDVRRVEFSLGGSGRARLLPCRCPRGGRIK